MGKGKRVTQLHSVKNEALKSDLEVQLAAAKTARGDKLTQSKAHLQHQLEVAAEKYLTVNGFMQARSILEQITFGDPNTDGKDDFPKIASRLAFSMSSLASDLSSRLSEISVEDLDDTFLEGLLDKNFVSDVRPLVVIAEQLLIVNLLQNIGPSIDDIVTWRQGADHGLAQIVAALAEQTGHVPGQTSIEDVGETVTPVIPEA
jgi:hypothetical protein